MIGEYFKHIFTPPLARFFKYISPFSTSAITPSLHGPPSFFLSARILFVPTSLSFVLFYSFTLSPKVLSSQPPFPNLLSPFSNLLSPFCLIFTLLYFTLSSSLPSPLSPSVNCSFSLFYRLFFAFSYFLLILLCFLLLPSSYFFSFLLPSSLLSLLSPLASASSGHIYIASPFLSYVLKER